MILCAITLEPLFNVTKSSDTSDQALVIVHNRSSTSRIYCFTHLFCLRTSATSSGRNPFLRLRHVLATLLRMVHHICLSCLRKPSTRSRYFVLLNRRSLQYQHRVLNTAPVFGIPTSWLCDLFTVFKLSWLCRTSPLSDFRRSCLFSRWFGSVKSASLRGAE